uniref:M20/M25/M40 family metallo-hydrolase n=1 Tax=Helicobacter typhlonius TaxID=76936 RepID=UPI002FE2CA9A
ADITPSLSTSGGTSDARFLAQDGIDVVELGVPNDKIHAINERVKISDVSTLHDVFVDFLQSYIKSAKNPHNAPLV